jgi:hypothetical protein
MLKIPELSEKDRVRYWLKVDKNSPVMSVGLDSCWASGIAAQQVNFRKR